MFYPREIPDEDIEMNVRFLHPKTKGVPEYEKALAAMDVELYN